MRRLAVADNLMVDGVMNASEGWFMPCGGEDVDQSNIGAVVVP